MNGCGCPTGLFCMSVKKPPKGFFVFVCVVIQGYLCVWWYGTYLFGGGV